MIRLLYLPFSERYPVETPIDQLGRLMEEKEGLLWVDIITDSREEASSIFVDLFHFHPLAVEDALTQTHVPKIDDWGDYLYLVLHGVDTHSSGYSLLSTEELDIFIGDRYLVTYRNHEIEAIDRIFSGCKRDERLFKNGPAYLLYQLADSLIADYLTIIDRIDERVNQIEDKIFTDPEQVLLEQIFRGKRNLLTLRRILSPQREVINKLARGDFTVIPDSDRIYFRDVYDHAVRLYDIIESLRDLSAGALDIYISVYSNRMTQVMKTLTVITTLFIPISFLSGFFGMNFFRPTIALDAWTGIAAFVGVLLLMTLTPLSMYLWMRRKAWM